MFSRINCSQECSIVESSKMSSNVQPLKSIAFSNLTSKKNLPIMNYANITFLFYSHWFQFFFSCWIFFTLFFFAFTLIVLNYKIVRLVYCFAVIKTNRLPLMNKPIYLCCRNCFLSFIFFFEYYLSNCNKLLSLRPC